ncbi:MAG: glycosyltransferase family 9 protein [Lentisphaerae bacterium]|nr:glycosyltransferase family 9 protein [Lentisphaerota bacterium]
MAPCSGVLTIAMAKEKNIQKILVFKPSSLGDILHVFPALQILHDNYPEADLDFVVNPEFAPLLDFSPFPVRRRILFERKKLAALTTAPKAFFSLIKNLRQDKYDLVIDFQGLFRSSFFARISSHCKNSVCGFASPREKISRIFYSRRVETKSSHAVEKNVELANFAISVNSEVPSPAVPIDDKFKQILSGLPAPYILLLPGARWESKCFPAKLFAETAVNISKQQTTLHFVIAGSKAEIPRAEELKSHFSEKFPVTDLTGKTTLGELFALINQADAVVCNDSGPMHIAALLQTPVFAFFGPTDPEKTGPWAQKERVFKTGCDCSVCMKKQCPLPETVCHAVDPQAVSSAILEQIYPKEQS